jgi:hypothetical protein
MEGGPTKKARNTKKGTSDRILLEAGKENWQPEKAASALQNPPNISGALLQQKELQQKGPPKGLTTPSRLKLVSSGGFDPGSFVDGCQSMSATKTMQLKPPPGFEFDEGRPTLCPPAFFIHVDHDARSPEGQSSPPTPPPPGFESPRGVDQHTLECVTTEGFAESWTQVQAQHQRPVHEILSC